MVRPAKTLTAAVAAYCTELHRIYASGGATGERSSYGPLANLLNAVGATLKPKVFCVGEMANQGVGHPDFGLYGARQAQRGRPRPDQIPERGVVEVKGADDDACLTATGQQVSRYRERYRLVLVTNLRQFVLVGEDNTGRPAKLETFQLAASAGDTPRLGPPSAAPWSRANIQSWQSGLQPPAPVEGCKEPVTAAAPCSPPEINPWKTFQGLSRTAERTYPRSVPQGKLLLPHAF